MAKSWLGPVPAIPAEFRPLDAPTLTPVPGIIDRFTEDPISAAQLLMARDSNYENPIFFGLFLCYCDGLLPSHVTCAVFANPRTSSSVLYYFFSAVNLDFASIHETAYLLLSRIAFSNSPTQVRDVFNAIADAYCTANPFVGLTQAEVAHLFGVCVLFSMRKRSGDSLSFDEFCTLLESVHMDGQAKKELYNELVIKPIPLFFTFAGSETEPQHVKSGVMKKVGGKIRSKKKRFYEMDGFVVKYYDSQSKKNLHGEIGLEGVYVEFVPETKGSDAHLKLARYDGQKMGQKKGKKEGTHTEYELYGESSADVRQWCETMNFVAFWAVLMSFLNVRK